MIDLKQYGYIENEHPPEGQIPGRVIELRREQYKVITEYGEVTAVLKGIFHHEANMQTNFPGVGDFVFLKYNEHGASRITKLLPRHSKFSRADFSGHAAGYVKTVLEQLVATNFDYVFVLSSLNWDFKVSRIMRYLTQTYNSGAQPVVVLTKADLVDNYDRQVAEVKASSPGIPVHVISAHSGYGLDELNQYLKPGKTLVFLGMSGVGKSSLLNVLMKQEVMLVKAIREEDSRGRHTTTHRQLFMLPGGAMVIDTPGMRELGLFDADEGISAGFADVEDLFTACRFNDCRHHTEPGCAVLAALADETLSNERWEQYLSQKRENRFVDDRSSYLNDKRSINKSIAMSKKQKRKYGIV